MAEPGLQKAKEIDYGNLIAHIFLWEKAFFLVPIWAIALVPILGFFCRSMGGFATQMGFGLVLCSLLIYFLEDLLKRKIRFDQEHIFFGFKAFPIKSIRNVDVLYKKRKFLPETLCLTSESGKKLKLSLSGLSEDGIETLLKHLEATNSDLKTAAVLNTLVKCRNIRRRPPDSQERLEIAYHSRRFISEIVDEFKLSALKWARIGPVGVCLLAGPLWIGWLSTLYTCLQPHAYMQVRSLNLSQFLSSCCEALLWQIGRAFNSVYESVHSVVETPLVFISMLVAVSAFFLYLASLLLKPNNLIADKDGLKLQIRFGEFTAPVKSLAWSKIQRLELMKHGSKNSKLRVKSSDNKNFDIDLQAISSEDRAFLLKKIEKLVPGSQIDHELSQAMLPRSDRSYTELWLQSLNQSPERKSLDPLDPGQVLADHRYEVLKSIGVGGQGRAYLCRPLEDEDQKDRTVVLKETIIPVFADNLVRKKSLESFEAEASLLMKLNHNGVVKLLDYFVEDHRAYLVLEHIDGCNLRELVMRDGPLAEEKVQDLAIQMCEILKYLHANSVVHRDFTPDNLILNSKGQLKLIDFNVAQQIQAGNSGTIVGKHAYLPPEQFRGKSGSQSDLYAMGATLFFLLTGTDPEPISQSSPAASGKVKVSEFMNNLVEKASALQLNKRYQSASEIEADLLASAILPAEAMMHEAQKTQETDTVTQENDSVTLTLSASKESEVAKHG